MPSKRKQAAAAKPKRCKKKIFLFLVEGKSDRKALSAALANTCYDFDERIEVFMLPQK